MSVPRRISSRHQLFGANGSEPMAATDGEINFLWWFIQGGIMNPETWNKLLRGYGLCERHAWIHINIEMSFRDGYLLGPTILYGALIEKSLRAVYAPRTIGVRSLIGQLRAAGPCFLCAMKVKNASAGVAAQARLDQGCDGGQLRNFAGELQPLWRGSVCPDCSGRESDGIAANRCRQHLLAAMKAGTTADIVPQRNMLQDLCDRLARYQRSFLVGGPKANDHDRAALLSAIGWCSGWRPLLLQLSCVGRFEVHPGNPGPST